MNCLKNVSEIATIETVKLSRCELGVLVLVNEGHSSKAVADHLFVTKSTVNFHLYNIYSKFNVNNRLSACRLAAKMGLVSTL